MFIAPAILLLAQSDAEPLSLEDIGKGVGVSSPEISPDGRRIAVVVSTPIPEKNGGESALYLLDAKTGAKKRLTYERPFVAAPAWSPNGDRLAFLARDPDRHVEVYVLPMDGGEAQKVTSAKDGVQQFAWKPDGTQIAYATLDEELEKKGDDKFLDAFKVGDNDFLETSAPRMAHLWVVDADGKNSKRLTKGEWTLPVSFPPGPPSSPIGWSPDGKSIVIVKQDDAHTGQGDVTTVQIVDVATQQMRPLTSRKRLESYPVISPDGKHIAYLYPRQDDWNQFAEVNLSPFEGGAGKSITADLDKCLYRARWTADSRAVVVAGNDTTQVGYWIQPIDGKARRLQLGRVNPTHGFWPQYSVAKDGTVAFVANEPDRPTEIYTVKEGSAPVRLTDFNHALDHRKLGASKIVEWKSDGFSMNGVVITPPDFDPSKKYPLVLVIHGGPNSASILSFDTFGQIMATHGYVVFEPNYRGSDNLGNAIYKAIEHNPGEGPDKDVMAGLDVVKKLPYVDGDNIAITGWSYGGFMTSWMIGHHDFWKCAVAGAPVTDYVGMYNLSDGSVQWRSWFGGSPYVGDRQKEYWAASPISYVSHMKTPTLIMGDVGDFRVPITQSYELYHALKDNGVTTEFVAIPADGHFPGDAARARDVYRRWIGWVDKYLGGKA